MALELNKVESFEIVLENWNPPTGNLIKKMAGYRYYKYVQLKDEWRRRFEAFFLMTGKRLTVKSFVEVRCIRYYTGRKVDRQNLVWAFKPALDVLQIMKVFRDDSEEYIDDHYSQEKSTTNRIVIRIMKKDPESPSEPLK